jgi:hypothetical protein
MFWQWNETYSAYSGSYSKPEVCGCNVTMTDWIDNPHYGDEEE